MKITCLIVSLWGTPASWCADILMRNRFAETRSWSAVNSKIYKAVAAHIEGSYFVIDLCMFHIGEWCSSSIFFWFGFVWILRDKSVRLSKQLMQITTWIMTQKHSKLSAHMFNRDLCVFFFVGGSIAISRIHVAVSINIISNWRRSWLDNDWNTRILAFSVSLSLSLSFAIFPSDLPCNSDRCWLLLPENMASTPQRRWPRALFHCCDWLRFHTIHGK